MDETGIPVIPELVSDSETPAEDRVAVAYAHYGTVTSEFNTALLHTYAYDRDRNQHWDSLIPSRSAYIPMARNEVVRCFLRERDAHWLLFLDVDMVFPVNTLETLMQIADPETVPVLGGLYLTPLTPDPMCLENVQYLPCGWTHEVGGRPQVQVYAVDFDQPLMPLHTVGMGCTLIHRNVFEQLAEAYPDDPWTWYAHDLIGGARCGEDVTFCARARELGIPIWGTTMVRCGHVKTHVLHPLSYRYDRQPTRQLLPSRP